VRITQDAAEVMLGKRLAVPAEELARPDADVRCANDIFGAGRQ
jgi:hypothetical protein